MARHCDGGFRMTVVSIIENGRGVGRGLRASGLAEHALDLGERRQDAVLRLEERLASVTEMPGRVVGM